MNEQLEERFRTFSHNALRIMVGLAFASHGAQKMLGWFGGFGADGGTAELMSRFGIAGTVELVGGLLIAMGLFTRVAAFIASGEMAVAYFWMHWAGSGDMWWWQNRGELVMIFCFVWLFFAAWGAGSFSVDAWLQRRRAGASDSGTTAGGGGGSGGGTG